MKVISIKKSIFSMSPTRMVVLSFAVLIFVGTVLLTLPIASNDGNSIGFINALFTSTSASCVTGLVIADTLTQWTLFGQITILLLIQCGGLGIITLTTFFSILLGRKVGLRTMLLAQESINYFSFEGILNLIKRIVVITFSIELIGAMLLSTQFVPQFGLRGLYMGIFHAISAFCNAGFDIIGGYKSLTEYNDSPIVIYTIAGLVITGGLGFVVWEDLRQYIKRKTLLFHTKVVLIITLFLIVCGSMFFFAFEYSNTMTNFTFFERINASFFHSVTTRTAGFNSLPLNDMKEISKVFTVILMFIGAAPGSTGGGVKVTTFGVIIVAIICQIKDNRDTIFLKRRVPQSLVNKAMAIVGLSGALVIIVTAYVLAIEGGAFINTLYEATSAFGTVGLSTGITPALHPASKLALILTMFLGRVGPLSFAIALALKANKRKVDAIYPEGKIIVG